VAEGLVLAGLGGTLSVAVAWLGIRSLVAMSPPDLPRVHAIALDATALAFILGVTALIGVLVGLAPTSGRAGGNLDHRMRELSPRTTGARRSMRNMLVTAEVALAVVLSVGAGLLLRSVRQLFATEIGFDAGQLLVMQVQTTGSGDGGAAPRVFDDALAAVRQLPGVKSATLTDQLPLSGDIAVYGVQDVDIDPAKGGSAAAFRYGVSAGYFEAMGVPLLEGRLLDANDTDGAPGVAVVSETFARSQYGEQSPVGERIFIGPTDLSWFTIVGVVGDVKQASLQAAPANAVYVTQQQWHFPERVSWLVVRAQSDAAALTPSVKRAVWSVDARLPIVRAATMESLVARSEAQRSFALMVLQAFALFALLLAGIGLYGVLAESVGERTRELGVRAALGASRSDNLALVVREGIALTGLGIAFGLLGAAAASEFLDTLLYGVTRLDPLTYLGVASVLLAIAALACGAPALRAMRVDPAVTLRTE
jgi:predicted permease